MRPNRDLSDRIAGLLAQHSGLVLALTLAVTALLVIPSVTLEADDASQDPRGEVFELRDEINDRFVSGVHFVPFIIESRSGDALTQPVLLELYRNEVRLKDMDARGELAPDGLPVQPYLFTSFDVDRNLPFHGAFTIADAVQAVLVELGTTLEQATEDQVKLAVHYVMAAPETSELRNRLSSSATSRRRSVDGAEIDYWVSPAFTFTVLADNERLGGGGFEIAVRNDPKVNGKERFNRNVQSVLRGEQDRFSLWGLAIDANLETEEEGRQAGLFIMLTVVGAVLIVGLSLRSYWATAMTGAGLGILMIWLKGISNLVGIKGGLIIELIVPIAMISLGVDFAVHALRRYQEERGAGYPARRALHVGAAGILGALVMAMLSDGVAFLSNASSGIEAVIHFGLAAAVATFSSFVVLGLVVPAAMMRIDELRGVAGEGSQSPAKRFGAFVASIGAATLAGTGVILLVAVSEIAGVVVLAGMVLGMLVAPAVWLVLAARRRQSVGGSVREWIVDRPVGAGASSVVEALVMAVAGHRIVVIVVAAAMTAAAVLYASRLDATLDVKDFFDGSSDFVVGLDKVDEHIGQAGGEAGIVYIRGDLADPVALVSIDGFIRRLADSPSVARHADGSPGIGSRTVLTLLERVVASEYARRRVEAETSVAISDLDEDGLPDSRTQIAAAYAFMTRHGVPLDERTQVYTVGQVRATLFHDPSGASRDITRLTVEIPGTREQAKIAAARDDIVRELAFFDGVESIARVGLTGSPFTRQAQLDATTRALQTSIPIAAAGAFVLLLVAIRSIRYAVVTIIPVGLVVAWLYGLMYLTGFSLNFVTATIGAVSIGVGIDFSIHLMLRFREELARRENSDEALRYAARGTGVALAASAASSIVGFGIMGFSPMPMFSSYGILTALMIFLALAASLLVLPSLLLVVSERRGNAKR